ncbi:hypothetical protein MTYP_02455 [Methylophilaceae bacterium]|nr:hypothetical protein MTYP_02455 [Methylophilaceae bacterium]
MTPTIEQVKQAARNFSSNATLANPDEKALHAYTDAAGNPLYWRIRLKNTSTGEKWIRPFHHNGNDFEIGEPPLAASGKPLYCLHLLAMRPDALTWIVEGEKAADALNKAFQAWGMEMQQVATTSGGAQSAHTADWRPLAGRQVVIWPDNDDPGTKYAAQVCECLQGVAASVITLDMSGLNLPAKGDAFDWLRRDNAIPDELLLLLDASRTNANAGEPEMGVPQPGEENAPASEYARDVNLIRASDVTPEPITWLWNGWLAAGKMHVFGGAPGTGKTTISMGLAATVTTGGHWPDGSRSIAGNVVIWSGEDDPADTLIPRLTLSGADLSRVYFIADIRDGNERRSFDPARDMEPLRRKLTEIGGVRLLIIDPVVSAIAGDSHKNAEVRRGLQPLVDMAASMRCALLGITHFSKGTGGRDPVERLTGSLAFGALARVVLVAAKHQEEGEDGCTVRLFCRAKSNIGPDDGGFEYDLHQAELKTHPGIFASSVLWGEAVEGAARELLATADATGDDGEGGTLADAKRFLADLLADGPLPVKAVKADADGAGYSWATIRRAQNALGIEPVKEGGHFGGARQQWVWRMPPAEHAQPERLQEESLKMLKSTEDAQQKKVSTFREIEHLQRESAAVEVEI